MTDDKIAKAAWFELCHRAWTEEDPVKLLNVTMQITRFLAKKQQQLDSKYDTAIDVDSEEQKIKEAQEAAGKSGLN